jgi:hypothetical protein
MQPWEAGVPTLSGLGVPWKPMKLAPSVQKPIQREPRGLSPPGGAISPVNAGADFVPIVDIDAALSQTDDQMHLGFNVGRGQIGIGTAQSWDFDGGGGAEIEQAIEEGFEFGLKAERG